MPKVPCLFCKTEADYDPTPIVEGSPPTMILGGARYHCRHCGFFFLEDGMQTDLREKMDDTLFRIACVLRERGLRSRGAKVFRGIFGRKVQAGSDGIPRIIRECWTVEELLNEFPRPTDLLDRALLNLSLLVKHPMESIDLTHQDAGFAFFCPQDYVLRQVDYMEEARLLRKGVMTRGTMEISIAPGGWARIGELRAKPRESKQGFVAMWFDPCMDKFFDDGVKPGIEDAGHTCQIIKNVEHINKICDEIVAEIRKSRFIVADFTGGSCKMCANCQDPVKCPDWVRARGGVYFEAGYAMGLGIPVIWTVRNDQVNHVHFDTRQYNHIVYETPADLREKLRNRIAATIH